MAIHFHDRKEAGLKLAKMLEGYAKDTSVVIYALPRGGVVLGAEIARHLKVPLSLAIARKIGHPAQDELAIGAVTETGEALLDPIFVTDRQAGWLSPLIEKQRQEAARRRKRYLADQPAISARDKIAIVVDDGVATGFTLRAALNELRGQKPLKLVVAVPMAPPEVAALLEQDADELIIIDRGDDYLGSVGAYYDIFPQVTDEEVLGALDMASNQPGV